MVQNNEVLTKSEFSEKLEIFAIENKLTHIEAILEMCNIYDMDVEDIPKMITEDLKTKIALDEGIHTTVYGKSIKLPI